MMDFDNSMIVQIAVIDIKRLDCIDQYLLVKLPTSISPFAQHKSNNEKNRERLPKNVKNARDVTSSQIARQI